MNLEQLTKTQIVLLTLLVSFVTSIATGIVTVTLVDQAPPAVTQTINRVIERTVEKVNPNGDQAANAGGQTVTEVQVVKENELVTEAITKVNKSLVRLYAPVAGAVDGSHGQYLGLGFVVSNDGLVATDSALVSAGNTYEAVLANGTSYTASLKDESPDRPTALVQLALADGETLPAPSVTPVKPNLLKLGETVIVLSGKERTTVSVGIVSDMAYSGGDSSSVTIISTNIADSAVGLGAPLVNIYGEIIGIYTTASGSGSTASFTPMSTIESQLSDVVGSTAGNTSA